MELRINPLVANDLKMIRDYIAEDNTHKATETINKIYTKFDLIAKCPGVGSLLSNRVSFETDYKYYSWKNYIIIYKTPAEKECVEIYRVINRFNDITRIFD